MRHMLLSAVAFGIVITGAAAAEANTAAYDQIVVAAQRVREEAEDVKLLLRYRAADQEVLLQRLSLIESHAQSLKSAIADVDAAAPTLSATQRAALARARTAADVVLVLLDNKTAIVADAERLKRQRGLLRDKADGIAQRALLVERQVELLRG